MASDDVAATQPSEERPSGQGRVTIAEIAELAEVSPATVSKVLNDREDVAPTTRARVQALLTETGYARRGSRSRTRGRLLDLVITELSTPWSSAMVHGAQEEAHQQGIGLVVTTTHADDGRPRDWISTVTAHNTEGVVLVTSRLEVRAADELERLGIPFVMVDPAASVDHPVPTVGAANLAGGLAATEHLISLGHRRIGVITGPSGRVHSQERLDGYRAALAREDLSLDPVLVRHGDFYPEGGRREASALLDLADPPTAIFAGSDLHAMGIYAEAQHRGMTIPDELSVVGFDDLQLCEWLVPQLTSVHYPIVEMSRLATRMVLDVAAGRGADEPPRIELGTRLVVRESTAPPAARS